jgi:hypothetical protein
VSVPVAVLPPCLRAALDAGATRADRADAVLAGPLGAIELAACAPAGTVCADGLFGADGYVLAASDAEDALMTGIVQDLPLQIALLVGLGPRPVRPDGEAAVGPYGDLEDARQDSDLPEDVRAVLSAEGAVHWRARAQWAAADGPRTREVVVVDGGPGGMLLCTPIAALGDVALVPCGSTAVWRALCALLPFPSELV